MLLVARRLQNLRNKLSKEKKPNTKLYFMNQVTFSIVVSLMKKKELVEMVLNSMIPLSKILNTRENLKITFMMEQVHSILMMEN